MAHPGSLSFKKRQASLPLEKQEGFQSSSSIIVIHSQREKWMQAAAHFRWSSLILPPTSETLPRKRIRIKKAAPTPTRTQRRVLPRPMQNLHGNLHGGGDKPFRFKVPPINTKFISSAEHWKTSTYLSFIVFLWHLCAAKKARSADFIWIKASPDGRPCKQDRQGNVSGALMN